MIHKIVLGTVQLGTPYGINNQTGQPDLKEAFAILDLARESGVSSLDTAEAYGDSQKLIGAYHGRQVDFRFKILTKFKKTASTDLASQAATNCENLHVEKLEAYSYHHFPDIFDDQLKHQLTLLKKTARIHKVGVSIYTHSEFKSVIQAPHVDVIQIPFNLLNHWGVNGALIKEAKQAAKEIHVRSVFLQGLFFMDPEKLPVHLQGLRPELKKLREIASSYGVSMAQMALTYASHFDAIDRILIGVETAAQLREVIGYLGRPLPKDCADRVSQIIVEHSHLIDPSQWARLAK